MIGLWCFGQQKKFEKGAFRKLESESVVALIFSLQYDMLLSVSERGRVTAWKFFFVDNEIVMESMPSRRFSSLPHVAYRTSEYIETLVGLSRNAVKLSEVVSHPTLNSISILVQLYVFLLLVLSDAQER